MTVFGDLVEEVLLQLEGFTGDQGVFGTLSGSLTDSASTFTVAGAAYADGSGFSPGIVEIEEELVYCQEFNRTTGVFTGALRGWRGSTAAAHSSGALVRNNPRFPRIQVKKAINDTIRNLYPKVAAIGTSDITPSGTQVRFQLPATALQILHVSQEDTSSTEAWNQRNTWRFIPTPGGSNDGYKAVEIGGLWTGRDVRVVYAKEPTTLSSLSDNFETTTGLPTFTRDAVVWGAMWRLYSMVELGRASTTTADQGLLNRQDRIGAGTDLAKYLLGMYQQALSEAENRWQDLYPAQIHRVW